MSKKIEMTEDDIQQILEKFRWGHPYDDHGNEALHGSAYALVDKKDKIVGVVICREAGMGINHEKLVIKRIPRDKSVRLSGFDDLDRNLVERLTASFGDVLEALRAFSENKVLAGPGAVYDSLQNWFRPEYTASGRYIGDR
jgi:hypothetical protein